MTEQITKGYLQRLREEISSKYPLDKDLSDKLKWKPPQITYILRNGVKTSRTRAKLVAAGLDMDYVETGTRKNDSIAIVREPEPEYAAEQKPFFRVVFEDVPEGVTIRQKQINGYLEIELYRGKSPS